MGDLSYCPYFLCWVYYPYDLCNGGTHPDPVVVHGKHAWGPDIPVVVHDKHTWGLDIPVLVGVLVVVVVHAVSLVVVVLVLVMVLVMVRWHG